MVEEMVKEMMKNGAEEMVKMSWWTIQLACPQVSWLFQ
jgi:hypothetical protein